MARTKASVGAKVSSGKSSKARCSAAPASSTGTGGGGSSKWSGLSGGGGNPVCPRETPAWQRPITTFFSNKEAHAAVENSCDDGPPKKCETRKSNRNIIPSDDEEEPPGEACTDQALDQSITLEPLDGDNSHKIEEYYPKHGPKGKGIGKKTANKENLNESNRRLSAKRDLEDIAFGEEPEQASKRIKVN